MQQVELTWGTATHAGQRPENEDRCLAAPPLFAVADGMGGHAAGSVASEAVIECLGRAAQGATADLDALRAALSSADGTIRALRNADGSPTGAGTTVAGVALVAIGADPYWAVFNIGDSRVYRWASTEWELVSRDHSVVQELLDGGLISADEAPSHPQRHVITRAIGLGSSGEAQFTLLPVTPGERFLLCSDGLSGVLDEAQLRGLMAADLAAEDVAGRLVAQAVHAGGADNVSAVVVHVHGPAAGPAADEAEEITLPRLPAVPGGAA
jgi:protein phosphatase